MWRRKHANALEGEQRSHGTISIKYYIAKPVIITETEKMNTVGKEIKFNDKNGGGHGIGEVEVAGN